MRHRFLASAFCASLLAASGALARPPLENIPLKWTPTATLAEYGPVELSGATITTKIRFETFVDTRENPALVAENREHPDKIRQVTTSGDVAAFVADHLKEAVHGAGLNVVDGAADFDISGEIRKIFVNEVSTYMGETAILIHVKDNTGKDVWSGVVTGGATRWGRSYSAENYYEAMSNMVLSAAYNLLSNPGFREALAKH